jgi:hypothetical protein
MEMIIMEKVIQISKNIIPLPILNPKFSCRLLDNLANQEGMGDKRDQEKAKTRLGEIDKHFNSILAEMKDEYPEKTNELIGKTLGSAKFNANEIALYSGFMAQHEHEAHFNYLSGMFLSQLINGSDDIDFILHAIPSYDNIGYCNKKNIVIDGEVGLSLGWKMEKGKITLNGSAIQRVGREMKDGEIIINGFGGGYVGDTAHGGKIIVNGDVGECCGHNLFGTDITVNGNAGEKVGDFMWIGHVRINGNIQSLAHNKHSHGSFIYQRGEFLYEDGIIYGDPKNL